MVEDLPVVEALPVVEDVIVALPVVEDVVEDLPAVEDMAEDVVEDVPLVELADEPADDLLQPLPAELTDALTDELFDRLTAHVVVDEPRGPAYVEATAAAADFTPALVPEGVAEFEQDEPAVFRIGSDQYDPFT